jgi:hypothetical protein
MLFKAVTGLLPPINLPAVLLLEVREGRHDVSPALQKKPSSPSSHSPVEDGGLIPSVYGLRFTKASLASGFGDSSGGFLGSPLTLLLFLRCLAFAPFLPFSLFFSTGSLWATKISCNFFCVNREFSYEKNWLIMGFSFNQRADVRPRYLATTLSSSGNHPPCAPHHDQQLQVGSMLVKRQMRRVSKVSIRVQGQHV